MLYAAHEIERVEKLEKEVQGKHADEFNECFSKGTKPQSNRFANNSLVHIICLYL